MATAKMYTTGWCPDCRRAKQFLSARGVSLEEINIDESPDDEDLVMSVNNGRRKVPTFEVDGKFFACSPFDPHLLGEPGGSQTRPYDNPSPRVTTLKICSRESRKTRSASAPVAMIPLRDSRPSNRAG